MSLERMAMGLVESQISVIPIKIDGSKAPALPWKSYQSRLPDKKELRKWFGNGSRYGIAAIGGEISGGLEILDFDDGSLFEPWSAQVAITDKGLLKELPVIATPGGGFHVYYRCKALEGNQKLATKKVDGRSTVMIETSNVPPPRS